MVHVMAIWTMIQDKSMDNCFVCVCGVAVCKKWLVLHSASKRTSGPGKIKAVLERQRHLEPLFLPTQNIICFSRMCGVTSHQHFPWLWPIVSHISIVPMSHFSIFSQMAYDGSRLTEVPSVVRSLRASSHKSTVLVRPYK